MLKLIQSMEKLAPIMIYIYSCHFKYSMQLQQRELSWLMNQFWKIPSIRMHHETSSYLIGCDGTYRDFDAHFNVRNFLSQTLSYCGQGEFTRRIHSVDWFGAWDAGVHPMAEYTADGWIRTDLVNIVRGKYTRINRIPINVDDVAIETVLFHHFHGIPDTNTQTN